MKLEFLPHPLTVCKPKHLFDVRTDAFFFLAQTDSELSLVCHTPDTPIDCYEREDGFNAFRVCGTLDFALTGILAGLSGALASIDVPIFAVSTFNTDYILVKSEHIDIAKNALIATGYDIL